MLENGADHISLPTRAAIPLGFIVNEIATNAVKHGFTDNEEPRFKIDLTTDKAAIRTRCLRSPFPVHNRLRIPV